jgi:hypothetical protein
MNTFIVTGDRSVEHWMVSDMLGTLQQLRVAPEL